MHVRRGGEKHTGAQIYRFNCFDFDSLLRFHRQQDGTHDVHTSLAGKEKTHSVCPQDVKEIDHNAPKHVGRVYAFEFQNGRSRARWQCKLLHLVVILRIYGHCHLQL